MGKKDKKKGKGAEKAQAKALKKSQKNDGGADMEELEALISQFKDQDRKENTVDEQQLEQPPRNVVGSLSASVFVFIRS